MINHAINKHITSYVADDSEVRSSHSSNTAILDLWWRHITASGNRLSWSQHCPNFSHWSVQASHARRERQSVRMSKITSDGLTQYGTLYSCTHMATVGVKGLIMLQSACLCYS